MTHRFQVGSGFTRSVCVREMDFGRDGKVNPVKMVKEGVEKGLKPLCPYRKVEAETIAWSKRMKSDYNSQVGVFVTALRNGSYTRVRDVDFGEKAPSRILRACLRPTMLILSWRYVLTDWKGRYWQN